MKKSIFILALLLFTLAVNAQQLWYKSNHKASLGGFVSDIGLGTKAGYSYANGKQIAYNINAFGDFGRPYQGKFQSYGVDAGVGYSPFWLSNSYMIFFNVALTGAYDNFQASQTKKYNGMSFGAKGGAELEYFLKFFDDNVSINFFANQAYYFKSDYGKLRYDAGIGLKFKL